MCSTVEAALEGVLGSVGGPAEEIVALVDLADRVQAALVERVGAFDASEGWAADGDFSFACWLRARADVTRAEPLQLGRFARTLRTMPLTERAVADGKVSVAKARLLAGVINERTAERFFEQEGFPPRSGPRVERRSCQGRSRLLEADGRHRRPRSR